MDSSTHAEAIHEPPAEDSIRAGHEVRDVNIRAVLWLGVAVAVGGIVVHVALWLLLSGLESAAERADPELSPLTEAETYSAAPRLQDKPAHDYLEYRRQQDKVLNSYGWVDRNKQVVRIPVSRARELILEQGLPEPSEKAESDDQEEER